MVNPGAPSSSSARWRSRGYLPHFEAPDVIQAITFRLADSLPREVLERIELDIEAEPDSRKAAARRQRLDTLMDAGHGSCVLKHPSAATKVQNALFYFDDTRYKLLAWVVMPNHVHTVIEPLSPWGLAQIMQSWKSYTGRWLRKHWQELAARPGSAELQLGPVWQREYWDRYIRDERHYWAAVEYIHANPVKAGLVARAEDWPWSSASARTEGLAPSRSSALPGDRP